MAPMTPARRLGHRNSAWSSSIRTRHWFGQTSATMALVSPAGIGTGWGRLTLAALAFALRLLSSSSSQSSEPPRNLGKNLPRGSRGIDRRIHRGFKAGIGPVILLAEKDAAADRGRGSFADTIGNHTDPTDRHGMAPAGDPDRLDLRVRGKTGN